MRSCGKCGRVMIPGGGVRVDGVRTTDRWVCPDCGHVALTMTGCGWGCTLPVVAVFGAMSLSLLARGMEGDDEGTCTGVMMLGVVGFLGWLIALRWRDAVQNPPI